MIRLSEQLSDLSSLPQNWAGIYIGSRAAAYGIGKRFAPFYTDEAGTLLSLLDGNAVLVGEATDTAEWADFLSHAEIATLRAERAVAEKLAKKSKRPFSVQRVMQLQQFTGTLPSAISVPSPREMYLVLSAVFSENLPAFDNWYVDISHRLRHGLCHVAGIQRDEMLVTVAMTVAETTKGAVLGSVATLPAYRKQGFSGACIGHLVSNLRKENPDAAIYIIPKTDYAESLYRKLGFSVCGEVGTLQFDNLKDDNR